MQSTGAAATRAANFGAATLVANVHCSLSHSLLPLLSFGGARDAVTLRGGVEKPINCVTVRIVGLCLIGLFSFNYQQKLLLMVVLDR